jgi:uncharacterized membrane protein
MGQLCNSFAICSLAVLVSMNAHAQAEREKSGLEALMTPEQYKAAGLSQLSEQQREVLYQWLREYAGKPADQPALAPAQARPAATVLATPAPPMDSPAVQSNTAPADAENFGFPDPLPDWDSQGNQLQARIVGKFRGWSGKTVFTLDNGQVWRQRVSGKYTYMGDDTRVVISQNAWGFYDLRLVAADRKVGVTRVK